MTQELILIAAVGANRAIGKDNRLLWSLPEDMKHFKALTLGHAVLMGRKTWESLPPKFRPLPGRRNIVLSRDPHYRAEGATVAAGLDAALAAAGTGKVFVIGGADIYALTLPRAQALELTEVRDAPAADAFFPVVDPAPWHEAAREAHPATDTAPAYDFVTYRRR